MAVRQIVSEVSKVAAAVAAQTNPSTDTPVAVKAEPVRNRPDSPETKLPSKGSPGMASKTPDQRVNLTITSEAKGTVLAESFVTAVKVQGDELKGLLKRVHQLSLEGHKAFQDGLQKARDAANLYHKGREAKDGTPNREPIDGYKPGIRAGSKLDKMAAPLTRSAFTRLSEATTFSKACQVGYTPDFSQNYHYIVVAARMFKDAKAGKTDTRKLPTPMEKAMAYIERLGLNKRQRAALAEKIEAL
jgi:hypothetical protein